MEISPGDFLYHVEYGVGQVIRVYPEGAPNEAEIQFGDRPAMLMTETIITRTCTFISPFGFRALAFTDHETAERLIRENPVEVIRLVLVDSTKYIAKTEEIKDYLSPYISDWDLWWDKTQPLLKEDSRIDTTNSRLREYALAREIRSTAEEAFLSFRFAKQRMAPPGELVDRAKAALVLRDKGETLQQEHAEEMLDFLRQVIYLDKFDLALRLSVLYRMWEEKWLSPDEAQERLKKLMDKDIRLYLLDANSGRGVIEAMIHFPLDERKAGILAGGICSTIETISRSTLNWALRKNDLEIISNVLTTALTDYLPPTLEDEKFPALKKRLDTCLILVKSLPSRFTDWAKVVKAFRSLNISLESVPEIYSIKILLPSLVNLGVELRTHIESSGQDESTGFLDSLASPDYRIDYILAIMEAASRNENAKALAKEVTNYLLQNAELRRDNFLEPFISSNWSSRIDQVSQLIAVIQEYQSAYLKELCGREICTIISKGDEVELLEALPYLNHLHFLKGKWSWKTDLERLREKGYFAMFRASLDGKKDLDDGLIHAVREFSNLLAEKDRRKITDQHNEIEDLKGQVERYEALIEEKDIVLRELKGSLGGDTEEARFEERSRILKELAASIADFERFFSAQSIQSRETDAVLRRLISILSSYKVIMTEPIGTEVEFNSQKHRVVESKEVQSGDRVVIMERGFMIRDHKNILRLLKPALVKKL